MMPELNYIIITKYAYVEPAFLDTTSEHCRGQHFSVGGVHTLWIDPKGSHDYWIIRVTDNGHVRRSPLYHTRERAFAAWEAIVAGDAL